jgi:hypothetical protein
LRVAEWLDRADAAKADIEELDLRDLRSVVAAGEDPMVARDESTRAVATELKAALVTKQESELALWFEDIDAAIGVGRVIRALKLSSQPPKAGVRFPTELAGKLAAATTANLTADAFPDRWVAVLEAAAFSPVRTHVLPTAKPTQVNDELLATVKRVGPLLPQIAALFEIEVSQRASAPKPLRPTRPVAAKKPAKAAAPRPPRPPAPPAPTAVVEPSVDAEPTVDATPSATQEPTVAEPSIEAEPSATQELAPIDEPTVEVEPSPTVEPAATDEPAPTEEPAPIEDAVPTVDAEPTVDAAPAATHEPTAAGAPAPQEPADKAEPVIAEEPQSPTAETPAELVATDAEATSPDEPATDAKPESEAVVED